MEISPMRESEEGGMMIVVLFVAAIVVTSSRPSALIGSVSQKEEMSLRRLEEGLLASASWTARAFRRLAEMVSCNTRMNSRWRYCSNWGLRDASEGRVGLTIGTGVNDDDAMGADSFVNGTDVVSGDDGRLILAWELEVVVIVALALVEDAIEAGVNDDVKGGGAVFCVIDVALSLVEAEEGDVNGGEGEGDFCAIVIDGC